MSTSSIANFAISKKKFSVWESGKLFAYQFFRFCMHTHKGVNIDLIAGFYFWTPLKKKKSQQQQQEKQQKTKTNKSSLPPWKNISGIHYLIHLKRTLLLKAMKKN